MGPEFSRRVGVGVEDMEVNIILSQIKPQLMIKLCISSKNEKLTIHSIMV